MKDETITALITALRSETAAGAITPESLGSLLQKIVDAIPSSGVTEALSLAPRYKITTHVDGDTLYILGDVAEILSAGYYPFLFRWLVKHNRHKNKYTRAASYTLNRKGWNPFFRYGKIFVQYDGTVLFRGHHDGKIDYSEEGTKAELLFSGFKYHYCETERHPPPRESPFRPEDGGQHLWTSFQVWYRLRSSADRCHL